MDRYGGFVSSNNYYGQPMPGQGRMMMGGAHQHRQTHVSPYQQPQKMTPAPVVINQPRRGRDVSEFDQAFSPLGRKWTTGKCGCFQHCPSCMAAFCCPPCFACYLSHYMNENPCGPMCGSKFMTALRTRLRGVNGIEGSVCKDMCACMCCPCCVLAQMYREIQNTQE